MHSANFPLLLCISCVFFTKALTDPCPFNELECQCHSSPSGAILRASCKSSALPDFTAPLNITYSPRFSLTIESDDVFNIPADYFAIFKDTIIHHLKLVQTQRAFDGLQNWDEAAFDGVRINQIEVNGLEGLIPPPTALTKLGATNLSSLTITDARTPLQLEDNTFEAFPFLTSLIIQRIPIEKIGDKAFAGLWNLYELELKQASLKAFPFKTISNLTRLRNLQLDDNPIQALPTERPTLPQKIKLISLQNTSLTSVDLSLFYCLNSCVDQCISIDLDYNAMLKNVTGATVHPISCGHILLMNTGVETFDPKLSKLMEGNQGISLHVSNNDHLICKDVAWMAYHVSCTKSLTIINTKCADKDGMLLEQYLKNVVPDPCANYTTSSTKSSISSTTVTVGTSQNSSTTTSTNFTTPDKPQNSSITTSISTRSPKTGSTVITMSTSTTPSTKSSTNFTMTSVGTSQNLTTNTLTSSTSNPTDGSTTITSTPDATRPCPFNTQECVCTDVNPRDPFIFAKAECSSRAMPTFTVPTNGNAKYTITGALIIRANVSSIPIRHFAAFKSIDELYLIQTKTTFPTLQKWDELAFDLVKIRSFEVASLEGVLPPPLALRRLGGRGLKILVVTEVTAPVYLNDYSFDAFPTLASLTLDNTNIVQIRERAFSGMEDHLDTLMIKGSSLTEFPSAALAELSNLQRLGFEGSAISQIPEKAFLPFPSLHSLSLSGNLQLGAAFINENILQVSSKLTHLYLDQTGLTAVPRDFIKNQSALQVADLSSNLIETISNDDFQDCKNLNQLHLKENPISSIEKRAFSHLKSVNNIDLSNTKLMSIDLSIFGNVQWNASLNLDDNQFLKSVTVSAINQIPSNARVSIKNSGLEVIDCKIANLLKQNPSVSIEISNNVQLLCNVHAWMTDAKCPEQLKIDETRCADKSDQLLSDYLMSINPNTTCIGNAF